MPDTTKQTGSFAGRILGQVASPALGNGRMCLGFFRGLGNGGSALQTFTYVSASDPLVFCAKLDAPAL